MNNDHIFGKNKMFKSSNLEIPNLANKCGQDIPENCPNAACILIKNIQGYEL